MHAPRRIGATEATLASIFGSAAVAKTGFAILREPLFGARHHIDHALIGFARRRAEGEDAVLDQHQPLDRGIGLVNLGGFLGERRSPA